ncbi:MAG: GGDEF domain-containing protein [Rhizobiaceae bacterium]|nr:GGDEF domain-containing protein [Rhizobiaceae bacterium]
MTAILLPHSRKEHLRLTRWAIYASAICVFASVVFNYAAYQGIGGALLSNGWLAGIAGPVLIAIPLFAYMALKMRQLELVNHELTELATTDALTSSLNRRAFTAAVERRLKPSGSAVRHGAMLMLDVDHFKTINDRFGHQAGDEALQLLARTIRHSVRTDDQVGRLGGEEFGILLPGASLQDATEVAERIRRNVAAVEFRPDGGAPHPLSISVGGATYVDDVHLADLFRLADKRLYDAKAEGRNQVRMIELPRGFGKTGDAPTATMH